MTFFFFNDTATTEIYTLSLHDALPISVTSNASWNTRIGTFKFDNCIPAATGTLQGIVTDSATTADISGSLIQISRSEEHTSELQSRLHLVCRLLLEKKNPKNRLPRLAF